jgi:hypothetical protein
LGFDLKKTMVKVGVIIFCSVRFGFYKKNNRTEPKPVQTDRFGFLGKHRLKTVLARFFPVWVRFSFFGFRLIKPNWTGWFFQNFNRFFFTIRFFQLFFFWFSQFNRFFSFFASPLGRRKKKDIKVIRAF